MIPSSAANPSNSPDIKLPLVFLVTGVAAFFLLNGLFFGGISDLSHGAFRGPMGWTLAHLTLLGWGTMIAMGAMYQLIPVALQVSVFSEKLGYMQYAVFAAGLIGLLLGFYTLKIPLLMGSGILTAMGIFAFIYNMLRSIQHMAKPTYISRFILSALGYLLAAVLLGLGLVLHMKWGILGDYQQKVFILHLMVGLVGWFTLLIIGFSYKMLPMFALAHGYSETLPAWILRGFHLGMLLLAIGVISDLRALQLLGLYTLAISFLLFLYDGKRILQKRMKKRLDIGLKASWRAAHIGAIASVFILAAFVLEIGSPEMYLPLFFLFIYGWISLSILGYLYKIVPFLWWTKKYSGEIGKKNVPQLKDLISESLGEKLFLLMMIGLVGCSLALLIHSTLLLYLFHSFVFFGSSLFTYAIMQVFRK